MRILKRSFAVLALLGAAALCTAFSPAASAQERDVQLTVVEPQQMLAAAHDLVSTKHGLSEAEAKDLQPGDVINIAVCSEYLLLEQLDTRSVSGALIGNRTVNRNLDTPQQSSTGPGVPGPVGLKQLQFDSVRQASVMDHARAWRLVTEPKKKRPQGGVANPLA